MSGKGRVSGKGRSLEDLHICHITNYTVVAIVVYLGTGLGLGVEMGVDIA